MNYETNTKPGGRKAISILVATIMVLTAFLPAVTEDANAA